MYAETIASGTELLMGEIQDTNSSWLASRLPELGLQLRQATLVGDDPEQYAEVVTRSWKRNQFTFTTGGLGPTQDDVTRETIALVLGEEPSVDEEQLEVLTDLFRARGTEMPSTNLKQAWLIPSAKAIPNRLGSAPGWWAEKDGHIIVALPGPPRELHDIWDREVVPRIRERVTDTVVVTRTLKTITLAEGAVDEMAAPVLGKDNPYVGVYAKPDGIHLRIIARGTSRAEANIAMLSVEKELRDIFQDTIWGADDETVENSVADLLQKKGLTLATMESCTGGLLADTITNVPGSSAYFKGGIVSYTNQLKTASGVPAGIIEEHGAVSPQTAEAMAKAVRENIGADFGIGITGIAGPEPLEDKPPGTVYIGVAHTGGTESGYHRFPSHNRDLIKHRAVIMALLTLRRIISDH